MTVYQRVKKYIDIASIIKYSYTYRTHTSITLMDELTLFDGRVHLYKRPNSRYFQCRTYLAGKHRRTSTKQEAVVHARAFAEEWYFGLRGKHRAGEIKEGETFRVAAELFLRE